MDITSELMRIKNMMQSSGLVEEEEVRHHYRCEKCKDTGHILINKEVARICECVRKAHGNIPPGYRDMKVSEFKLDVYKGENKLIAKKARDAVVGYTFNYKQEFKEGMGLYLYSKTPGSGKTRLSLSVGNALVERHHQSVLYTTISELAAKVKATFKDSYKTEEMVLDHARKVDVLILDDVGTEKLSEWVESIVYSVIDYRCEYKKVTIFSSNYIVDELEYQPRIKSRIASTTHSVVLPEEDIRVKLKELRTDLVKS